MSKKLYYRLYNPCGLFNQITSLELAVGLSQETNREMIIHNFVNSGGTPIYSQNHTYNDRLSIVKENSFGTIYDFMDWKNKENFTLIKEKVKLFPDEDILVSNLMQTYFSSSQKFSQDEDFFSEGRTKLFLDESKNIHLKYTLGYYSRFFYNRSKELNDAISSVKFKQEYYDFARLIADSLGDFNGAHLRLTDHKDRFPVSKEYYEMGIDSLAGDLPVVLCTDEANNFIIDKSKVILLDEYILNNFYKEFSCFQFKDEIEFGLINNLVMHYAKDFIGTSGSTYTGYIYRNINQKNNIESKLFGEAILDPNGPYSWNGYEKDNITKMWWREWKESKC
jgi:hypothetical protein